MIIYEGPSALDGAPIVVIVLAGRSTNSKTGEMVQTYILRSDMSPIDAVARGADVSICGDCPHRGTVVELPDGTTKNMDRTCYVNLGHGPRAVYDAYLRGVYPRVTVGEAARAVAGRLVRIGTYGDPTAIDVSIWARLVANAKGHTGYTHQWRARPEFRGIVMASADNETDATDAHAAGWRTFRVAMPGAAERLANEAICPASAEAGKKLQCADCLACSGASGGRRGSIVIQAHGSTAVMANVRRAVA